jgi:hypothetical protein
MAKKNAFSQKFAALKQQFKTLFCPRHAIFGLKNRDFSKAIYLA